MNTIFAADLFCGAGGASAGLFAAARTLKANVRLVAVNHWPVAIETHAANYPGHIHYCQAVGKVSPREAVPGGRLHLLLAGPECTHHSNARGGKPMSDQSCSSAFDILEWCRELLVENVLIENVPEFLKWGPLDPATNRPNKQLQGALFREFVGELTNLGYTVEWRILNAAHFGDATTRKRLFVQARKTGNIVWPVPSHHAPAELPSFPAAKAWRSAREIIDWSLPSQSIFTRKRPLAPATLRRIARGLEKFCGLPFVLGQQTGYAPRQTDDPLPVIATAGKLQLVEPFLVILRRSGGEDGQARPRSLDEPVPTVCAGANHIALCEPRLESFLIPQLSGAAPRSVKDPLNTITATGTGNGLVQPFLVGIGGPTGQQPARSVDEPMVSILGNNSTGLCQPFLVRYNGGDNRIQALKDPITTLDASNRFGLCEPFLVSYQGNDNAQPVTEPLNTITARDRFALVQAQLLEQGAMDKGDELALLDVRFRMLQPHELAAARLANTILRGVASLRPRVTAERWDEATAKLPDYLKGR